MTPENVVLHVWSPSCIKMPKRADDTHINIHTLPYRYRYACQDGYALQFAATSLRADNKVVLAPVSQGGYTLKYAAKSLRVDNEVVLAAVHVP